MYHLNNTNFKTIEARFCEMMLLKLSNILQAPPKYVTYVRNWDYRKPIFIGVRYQLLYAMLTSVGSIILMKAPR